MVEHDDMVGEVLKKIDDLGIADNTIVIYSTDNGAETFTWPDGGITPFHGEKGTTWEGGMRVPCVVRWPGVIKPGTIYNDIMSQEDWMPTLLAAAGDPMYIVEKLKKGYQANGKTFKVHLTAITSCRFKGQAKEGPRKAIVYFSQGGNLNAVRYDDWKIHFATTNGNIATGVREITGWPMIINLRADPFEKGPHEADMGYLRWYADNMWLFVPVQGVIKQFLGSIDDYPLLQHSQSGGGDEPHRKDGGFCAARQLIANKASTGYRQPQPLAACCLNPAHHNNAKERIFLTNLSSPLRIT
jgi:arylsulfatase A-like enzyme